MPSRVLRMAMFIGLLLAPLATTQGAGSAPMPRLPVLAWSFDIHDDPSGSPRGRVFLRVNGRSVLVLPKADMQYNIVLCSEYHGKKVPAAALTACAGWWAGAGVDLYVIRRGQRLNVFRRDEDEESGDSAYRLIKSVPILRR